MTLSFTAVDVARPAGQQRAAKAHFALLVFYGLTVLLALFFGVISMDQMPWSLVAVAAVPMAIHFILHKGVLAEKTWARYGSVAVGVLLLPLFPIGTAIGSFFIFNAGFRWGSVSV